MYAWFCLHHIALKKIEDSKPHVNTVGINILSSLITKKTSSISLTLFINIIPHFLLLSNLGIKADIVLIMIAFDCRFKMFLFEYVLRLFKIILINPLLVKLNNLVLNEVFLILNIYIIFRKYISWIWKAFGFVVASSNLFCFIAVLSAPVFSCLCLPCGVQIDILKCGDLGIKGKVNKIAIHIFKHFRIVNKTRCSFYLVVSSTIIILNFKPRFHFSETVFNLKQTRVVLSVL